MIINVTTWCKLKFDGDVKKEDIIKKLEEGYLTFR
jgi:hypothetical protein